MNGTTLLDFSSVWHLIELLALPGLLVYSITQLLKKYIPQLKNSSRLTLLATAILGAILGALPSLWNDLIRLIMPQGHQLAIGYSLSMTFGLLSAFLAPSIHSWIHKVFVSVISSLVRKS